MMALERLPAEVVILIASEVKAIGASLASFAATSKQCQRHVERMTFLSLAISDCDLAVFACIVNSTRYLALRRLRYVIESTHVAGKDDRASRVSEKAIATYDNAFTCAVRALLAALKNKGGNATAHPGLQLYLEGRCVPSPDYLAPAAASGGIIGSDQRQLMHPEGLQEAINASSKAHGSAYGKRTSRTIFWFLR